MKKQPAEGLGRSVTAGAGWLISASLTGRLVDTLSVLILARILVPADFGLVALATSLFYILSVVTDLQVSNALIRLPVLGDEHYETALTISLLRSLFVIIGLSIGGYVLSFIYNDHRIAWLCLALCLSPLASGFISPRYVLYAREMRFLKMATLEVTSKLIGFAVAVAIAFSARNYWAVISGQIVSSIALSIMVGYLLPYRLRFSFQTWRAILSFSLWSNLTSITSTLSGRFDNFLVAGMLSRSVLGYYVLGDQLASMLYSSVLAPLQRVLYPGFSRLLHEPARLTAAFVRSQQTLAMIALPVGVGLALVADPVIAVLLGPKWKTAASVVEFVSPVFAFQALVAPINSIVAALGRQKLLFKRSVMILVIRVPMVVAGLYYFQLQGLLIARIMSGGFVLVLFNALLVSHLVGVSVLTQVRQISRSLVAIIAMAGACIGLRIALGNATTPFEAVGQIAVVVLVGVIVYLSTHFGLWHAQKRPRGGETEVIELVTAIVSKFRKRRQT